MTLSETTSRIEQSESDKILKEVTENFYVSNTGKKNPLFWKEPVPAYL